jgi:hypothetical protein
LLKTPIILISGDADEHISIQKEFEGYETKMAQKIPTSVIDSIVSSKYIVKWFAQNCLYHHPKVIPIPIGFDYHTFSTKNNTPLDQEKQLLELTKDATRFYNRKSAAYTTFHFTLHRGDRQNAFKNLDKTLVYYEPVQIDRLESWKKQLEYAFVISPFGNGPDCHRTWEALCLGCIPIVKTSPLDDLYEGLPVLIIGEWRDICESLLIETMENMKDAEFLYEKLTLQYWMDTITNHTRENTVLG